MNKNFYNLVDQIQERFARLDVRTDQCDAIRIIAKGVLVGIEQKGDEFVATFISLESEDQLGTTVFKTLSSTNLGAFEAMVLEALVELVPHRKEP
jgi:hypothetical protein